MIKQVLSLSATLAIGATVLPMTVFAQSGSCATTGRFAHSIEQTCDDGSVQLVFFPAAISGTDTITVQDSNGQTLSTGAFSGPWIIWTDNTGAKCATAAVVSHGIDFYPSSCPGVPTV